MTIKQLGGVFGRNPTFEDVTIEGTLTFDGDIDINSDLRVDGDLDVNGTVTADRASSDGTCIDIQKDGVSLGTLGASVGDLFIQGKLSGHSGLRFDSSAIIPFRDNSISSNTTDLGLSNVRFKDIYLGGNVVVTSGQGIDFSATSDGSGTSTSELFDDYEEGTWTPTIGGVSVGSGNYTKVGALVFIECLITANSVSTTTINGLPYDLVSAQGYGGVSFGRLYNASVLDANGVPCRVRLSGGNINFRNNAVNATDSNFTITTPASGTVRLGINGVAWVS